MNWKASYDYYDPYKQSKSPNRNKFSPNNYQRNDQFSHSNERKVGPFIITSSSKDKKRVIQIRSISKDKKTNQQKPRLFLINNEYFIDKKDQNGRGVPQTIQYKNKKLEIIPQTSGSYKKSPIKIIKKSPGKMQMPVPFIKTTVTAPSSIASSVLNNLESNPDRLLENMTDSKLEKVFKH